MGTNAELLGSLPRIKAPDGEGTKSSVKKPNPDPARESRTDSRSDINDFDVKTLPSFLGNVTSPGSKGISGSVWKQR